ncbi:hypothetical protein FF011L_01570 [Roseimaritima multifibrata]|uniref:Uncharacterized protein n=1 Tax=Roseimaritima multifibrata TaxID=1930274 RepID=A0A517M9G5_9BACT|nr:hypothetical protein [Roseimaritima multifibrata]QDS91427.1 hypothetical protein FF011L_01570 [Roseimaritima multifibrata]
MSSDVLREKDLEKPEIKALIQDAEKMWFDLCEAFDALSPSGCAVKGAGISVHYRGYRCRKTNTKILISTHRMPLQGDLHLSATAGPVVDYLKGKGLYCFYDAGDMD